ncbi:hypothetical protein BDN67DRAFT_1070510, partial [Paxillus ammoniavirescens]
MLVSRVYIHDHYVVRDGTPSGLVPRASSRFRYTEHLCIYGSALHFNNPYLVVVMSRGNSSHVARIEPEDTVSGLDDMFQSDFTSPPISRDLPISVDEKLMNAGADMFFRFEKRVGDLDEELRSFESAVRLLGSSARVPSSAFKLREHLTNILFLFRENAANLYPRKITRQPREMLLNSNVVDRHKRMDWRGHRPSPVAKHLLGTSLEPDTLPSQFESFARDIVTFLNCLDEFVGLPDDVSQPMQSFEGDLKYWASCLAEYKGQFRSPAVQRYIHDLTTEIGDHIDNLTTMFIQFGVPTIKSHQRKSVSKIMNLSTLATFFSAVTATTLQFSYSATEDVLSDFVNAFWFSSLVLSIAAAVNSLLGLTWKQAMRSPERRIPWWVLRWIELAPLVFLMMSIACFSSGLILFTYSSGQGPVTRTMITALTAFTSFGLAAVAAWFALERWVFVFHRGQRWLNDVVSKVIGLRCSPVRGGRIPLHWCRMQ